MAKQWYIVHTYSGYENKVRDNLKQRAEALGMTESIGEILIPTEDVVEMRDGARVISKKKFFPGYVLINMEMSDTTWHVVNRAPKRTKPFHELVGCVTIGTWFRMVRRMQFAGQKSSGGSK